MSHFHLRCSECERTTEPSGCDGLCAVCHGVQLVEYHQDGESGDSGLLDTWRCRPAGMWRFREWMPLAESETPVSLGEGDTPLVPLPRTGGRLGLSLMLKDEAGNPTGSFKDRGMSAAISRAVHDGVEEFVIPSAGNAGVALSAYAARAGVGATVFLPADTPQAVTGRCALYGSRLHRVEGLISDCGRAAADYASRTGAFDLSTLREPYRIEGKKTMGLEILEALGWRAPDAIVYPTGGGTGLIGSWKAVTEVEARGWLQGPPPRMYAVQAEGCAPIVRAFGSGATRAPFWGEARTRAWGLRVPSPRGDAIILQILRRSSGGVIAVTDEAMEAALRALPIEDGVQVGIEGGAVLAGIEALRERGDLRAGERVVGFNTGNLANY